MVTDRSPQQRISQARALSARPPFIRLATVAGALLLLAGCVVNPVTGRQELQLYGPDWEVATGRQSYVPLQQQGGGLYKADPALTDYVATVGHRLAAVAERRLPYEFVVINNSEYNAWALPGGKIGVNRGLLVALESEAELAALLGHEVAHAAARHSARQAEQGLLADLVLATAEYALDDEDYADLALAGAQVGGVLIRQRFSRGDELEADYHGMRYMAAAGYNPQGAVTLQQKLLALNDRGAPGLVGRLLASHPPSPERVANNRATVAALGGAVGESGRQRYQDAIAYAKSKQAAYANADEARALALQGSSMRALAKIERAIAIEPNEARFYGLKGDLLRFAGRHREALIQIQLRASAGQRLPRLLLGKRAGVRRSRPLCGCGALLAGKQQHLPHNGGKPGAGCVAAVAGRRQAAALTLALTRQHQSGGAAAHRGVRPHPRRNSRLDSAHSRR